MPDGIHESDLVCQSSDADADLDKCLESNDEQIISSLITIKPKNDKRIKFKVCNICIIFSCVVRPRYTIAIQRTIPIQTLVRAPVRSN
jgi:hypothetical protein